MGVDFKQLYRNIDSFIAENPGLTSRSIARELDVSVRSVEQAVREVDGVSFDEFRENRRRVHALKLLDKKQRIPVAQNHKDRRTDPRMIIPGATVSYLFHGGRARKSDFSDFCPLFDLSKGGMSFLSDHPSQPGRQVSLLIKQSKTDEILCLEGRVVYAEAVDIAGYRYRIGVQFMPFDAKKGSNSPEALDFLAQIMSHHTRRNRR